jgi:AcrR family transcriptional regulator
MLCVTLEPMVYQLGASSSSSAISSVMLIFSGTPTLGDCAVQAHLLQAFRDTLQLDISQTGEPAERLRQFVAGLFNKYEQQGAALTTVLELDEPAIRAQVRDMRAWRQDRLEEILRTANGTLRLPLGQAVAFAFVLTNHVSWRVLREEIGLTQGKAIETTVTGLEAGLFGASATHATRHAQSA